MKVDTSKSGVELIAEERAQQKKRWGDEHDNEHDDRSLALAACAYAAPEPLYVKVERGMLVTFADVWPDSWDSEYDKRPRLTRKDTLIPAHAMPIPRRLRQLQKAGALIAAEMDRLLRRLATGDEGDAE